MSILCRIVGHRRSAKLARFDYERQGWNSSCRRCAAPMHRTAAGEWLLGDAAAAAEVG